MIKHKNITLAIVLVVTTAMAFVGCKKTEKPGNETPNPDTLVTDTIPEEPPADNIYQFKVLNGEGDSVSLAEYRDKVLLVVNTATQCGYTPQYTDLQRIYDAYKDSGFVVLDFPCNQFGGQAPGSFDDIHDFCTSRYGIPVCVAEEQETRRHPMELYQVPHRPKRRGETPFRARRRDVDG